MDIRSGDENRNITSETFPDIYFPIHINQSKNSQQFQSDFKYIPFLKNTIITEKEQ